MFIAPQSTLNADSSWAWSHDAETQVATIDYTCKVLGADGYCPKLLNHDVDQCVLVELGAAPGQDYEFSSAAAYRCFTAASPPDAGADASIDSNVGVDGGRFDGGRLDGAVARVDASLFDGAAGPVDASRTDARSFAAVDAADATASGDASAVDAGVDPGLPAFYDGCICSLERGAGRRSLAGYGWSAVLIGLLLRRRALRAEFKGSPALKPRV